MNKSNTATKHQFSWPNNASSKKQQFGILDTIIYYIARNPRSPKIYSKLTKCCKYFFEKHPILIVPRIYDGGKKFCSSSDKECIHKGGKCCIPIDIKQVKSKIWVTDRLILYKNVVSNTAKLLLPQLYRYEDALLELYYTKGTIEDFKLWTSAFQKYCLRLVKITDNDGNPVMFERIIESIPNVKEFIYSFSNNNLSATTLKTILNLNNLKNLNYFRLIHIPEFFDIQDISDFIKAHKDTNFCLHFDPDVSQEYKSKLNALIDNIIASEVFNRVIYYEGQNKEKRKIMKDRYYKKTVA